ncbi:MAG: hypothetical protein HOD92_11895 [Deltaproteobacteria bacterium]|jgi:hypothetical protein|nr:hypothetical protein [Deltaproteobacteria bacterium]MBT4525324.1 hypothetical protein [Deltaproteobacteria bacterium]
MSQSPKKDQKLITIFYGFFLIGLSLLITLFIASEEAGFLMTVFEGNYSFEKSVAVALFNAIVPIAIVGAYNKHKKFNFFGLKIPTDFFRYRLPVFCLGIIVLYFASYYTVKKDIGAINSKNWAENRIVALDNQIARNERLLESIKGQKHNTAITVQRIQSLEREKLSVKIDPKQNKIEVWSKVILLTAFRVVLWFLAIAMSRRAIELIRGDRLISDKDQNEANAKEIVELKALIRIQEGQNSQQKIEIERLKLEINELRSSIAMIKTEFEEKLKAAQERITSDGKGLNEFIIKKKLIELKQNKDLNIEIKINGESKSISPTHRSILVNYALPFVKSLMNGNTKIA